MSERALGRYAAEDIKNALNGEVIVQKNDMIDEAKCEKLESAGVKTCRVYSVITCDSESGVCAMSYGRDLARGIPVSVGECVVMFSAKSFF